MEDPATLPGAAERMSPLEATLVRCASAILCWLSLAEATPLRAASVCLRAAVADHPWDDPETEVQQAPWSWRVCFPNAVVVRSRSASPSWLRALGGTRSVLLRASPLRSASDADIATLAGTLSLSLRLCDLPATLSSDAFRPLRGSLRVLDVGHNAALHITDAVLAALAAGPDGSAPPPLASICFEKTDASAVTAAGWAALRGVREVLAYGSRLRVDDAGLAALAGAGGGSCGGTAVLDVRMTDRSALTDAGVLALTRGGQLRVRARAARAGKGVSSLPLTTPLPCAQVLRLGWQPAAWLPSRLTDAAFALLGDADELDLTGCFSARGLTDAGLRAALARVGVVHARGCTQLSAATRAALAAPGPR